MNTFNNVRSFLDSFKKLSFWQRLFSWSSIRALSYSAWEEFIQLTELVRQTNEEKDRLASSNQLLIQERSSLLKQAEDARINLAKVENQLQSQSQKSESELKQAGQTLREKESAIQKFEQRQTQLEEEYQLKLAKALSIQELFEREKSQLNEARFEEVRVQQERQRRTWADHEKLVERTIRRISTLHAIEYVSEFPFRGKPDNAIRIAGETIVFDAKSPAGDDLGNFRSYIKQQVEAAKKYAEHESVRKDVYLVVPTSAVEVLDQKSFDLGTYRVYVITLDALEPVVLSLKQIEAYQFVDQMSPEERQSICSVIGSLIYASKRRVQVDQYFNGHLLDLIRKVQTEIPESLQKEIGNNEKAMMLNPPMDKRSKEISTDKLVKIHTQMSAQANSLDAPIPKMIELLQ